MPYPKNLSLVLVCMTRKTRSALSKRWQLGQGDERDYEDFELSWEPMNFKKIDKMREDN